MRLRRLIDKVGRTFAKGGRLYPVYEMVATFILTPGKVAANPPFVRASYDTKRIMGTVALSLVPIYLFGMWNVGQQASLAILHGQGAGLIGWQGELLGALGVPLVPGHLWSNWFVGFVYVFPMYVVTLAAGGIVEVLFSVIRRHEVTEGFLVTAALYPLTLPPHLPLWEVAFGIIFGCVIAKELFGGQGKNFINPALAGRAFVYFAYPVSMSGTLWVAVDHYTKPTPLSALSIQAGGTPPAYGLHWIDAFLGVTPGSVGETSALLIAIIGLFLIFTCIVNWRYIVATLVGMIVTASVLNLIGSASNVEYAMPWYWHLVAGGYMFGLVFMVTEPVTGPLTNAGRWMYGLFIGFLIVFLRVVNPAYPGATMLAILFGNVFAPLMDYVVIMWDTRRRRRRYETV